MEKITKREKFEALIDILNGNGAAVATDVLIDFCDKEIAALDAKAEKARERAAAKRAESDELKDALKAVLTEDLTPIADIITKLDVGEDEDITVGKVAYRLSALVTDGFAAKSEIKVPKADGKGNRTIVAYKLA